MYFLTHKANVAEARTEMLSGREHLVIPTVAAVEGVLNGGLVLMENMAPTLEAWEGVAVTMDHPHKNGKNINANTKDALEKFYTGRFFNTHIDEANKSLDGEFWIDLDALSNFGDDKDELLKRVENKETIEVSTGYFCQHENKGGIFKGKQYNHIQHNFVPNHVAILLHDTGACSVADGCGTPRVNSENKEMSQNREQSFLERWGDRIKSLVDSLKPSGVFANKTGYREISRHLQEILANKDGGKDTYVYIIEVFDDTVVYAVETFSENNYEFALYRRSYKVENEKTMEISVGNKEEVRQVITFEPVANSGAEKPCKCHDNEGGSQMDRNAIIAKLAGNTALPFSKAELEAMDDGKLQYLANMHEAAPAATPAATAETPAATPKPEGEGEPAAAQGEAIDPEVAKTLNSLGSDGIKKVLNAATQIVANEKSEKDRLVSKLKANARCQVPAASLEAMDLEALRGLDRSFNTNFSGRGGPAAQVENESAPAPTPSVFLSQPQARA